MSIQEKQPAGAIGLPADCLCAGPREQPMSAKRLGYKVPIDQADGAGGGSGDGAGEPLPSSIIVPCGWQHPDDVLKPLVVQQPDR